MAVSSNTLFHVTNKKENLYNILREQAFRVHYCLETFSMNFISETTTTPDSKGTMGRYIPMVSFCDIPLRDIKPHFEKYHGVGAIGLSKEWGIEKGLNTVLYTHHKSKLTEKLIQFFLNNFEQYSTDFGKKTTDELYRSFWYVLCHTKNYKGIIKTSHVDHNNLAYDEKEWRFVPTDQELLDFGIKHDLFDESDPVDDDTVTNPLDVDKYYEKIINRVQRIPLEFTPNDIKYIIVESGNDVREMIKFLQDKFKDDAEKLIANIFTKEQIFNDLS